MKFTVHRTAFIQYLNDVQRAISSKAALEILSGIKLDLSEDGLTMTGSNSDISIETVISIADENAALNIEKLGAWFYQLVSSMRSLKSYLKIA